MAVVGGIAAGVGALGGAAISAGAAKKSAREVSQATTQAGQLQQRQFEQTRADLAPWRKAGGAALGQYAGFLGVPGYGQQPTSTPYQGGRGVQPQIYSVGQKLTSDSGDFGGRLSQYNTGRFSSFRGEPQDSDLPQGIRQPVRQQSTQIGQPQTGQPQDFRSMLELYPSYQFAREEGLGTIERTAAARGGLLSGQTMKAAQRFGTGLAGSLSENYLNRLASLAGVGQTTAVQTGQLGAQSAAYQGQLATSGAQARASGYTGAAGAWGEGIGQLGQLAGYYSQPSYGGSGGTAPYEGSGGYNQDVIKFGW